MVWGFFPIDPLSGEERYYIFAKGTYKIGRKGCDVTITKDKGVSRVHSEIVVGVMEHQKEKSSKPEVRLRDCSKYGTFITRGDGAKEKVHESLTKELALKDGDLVSFGTGNAMYRFCFVPLVFYVCHIEGSQGFHSVQDTLLSIGAIATKKWIDECTHVIVDQFAPVDDDLIGAIVSKKTFASHKWLELLIESRICHEIPSCSSYLPTLTLDGVSVAVADNTVRENCLKGYTFILDSAHEYKFPRSLPFLLEVGGAKTISVEYLDSNSQDMQDERNRNVHVVPAGYSVHSNHGTSKLQVNELDLIRAVISGYLDPSILVVPAIVLSSSSTDETIVADSDAETETESATSQPVAYFEVNRATKNETKEELYTDHVAPSFEDAQSKMIIVENTVIFKIKENDDSNEQKSKVDPLKDSFAPGSGNAPTNFVERNDRSVVKGRMSDGPEDGCSEVLYSQALIMKDVNVIKTLRVRTNDKVVNFKRFRKIATQPGNSFTNLVPFSKIPYMNSEYEKEVAKSVEEEKKRKKKEAMAEELFNSEKAPRRGAVGSLHTFLTRR